MNKRSRGLIYGALLTALPLLLAMPGPTTWGGRVAQAARAADSRARSARASGCGQPSPVTPGASSDATIPALPAVSLGRRVRGYRVHVPRAYTPSRPLPMLLVFHGHGGDGAGIEAATGFSHLAEQRRFIAVYPQGLPFTDGGAFWASAGPIDEGIDDLVFIADLLTALQRSYCIDASRIYATGFSSGGGMANFLACRLAGRIAAAAPVSGNYYPLPGGCHPSRPIAVLSVHGSADPILPYGGLAAQDNGGWTLPAIPDWLREWATLDGCRAGPTSIARGAGLTEQRWSGCRGGSTIIHYRVEGGGHTWPATLNGRPTTAVMWDFFAAHTMPPPSTSTPATPSVASSASKPPARHRRTPPRERAAHPGRARRAAHKARLPRGVLRPL